MGGQRFSKKCKTNVRLQQIIYVKIKEYHGAIIPIRKPYHEEETA